VLRAGVDVLLDIAATQMSHRLSCSLQRRKDVAFAVDPESRQVAKTWVGNGPNKAISSDDLAKALGGDQINTLMTHTGLSRQDLLAGLSQYLPEAVNQLTPDGRLPTEQELSRSL